MHLKNALFAACSAGLCNRLLVLTGSLRIAGVMGRIVSLYWPVNRDVGCRFEQLFSNPFPMVTEADIHRILLVNNTVKIYNAWRCDKGDLYSRMAPDGDAEADLVIIKGFSFPTFIHETDQVAVRQAARPYLLALTPVPEIQEIIDPFPLPSGTIGVHIRRGDAVKTFVRSKDHHFVAIIQAVLQRVPQAGFFLSTDCSDTEQRFRSLFGKSIFTFPKRGKGRAQELGMKEALIDLMLLARTTTLIGNVDSSFSETSALIGGQPIIWADEANATTQLDIVADRIANLIDERTPPGRAPC